MGDASCPISMCVVECIKRLSNTASTPTKQKRHFSTNQVHIKDNSADY